MISNCSARQAKAAWFAAFLELPHGIPSHDTFNQVFAAFDPVQFRRCFLSWMEAMTGYLNQNDPSLDPRGWLDKVFAVCPFTLVFNVTGHPAMSLPLAQSAEGLPIGVQIVGRYGEEATLFQLAAHLEQALPWIQRLSTVTAGSLAAGRV